MLVLRFVLGRWHARGDAPAMQRWLAAARVLARARRGGSAAADLRAWRDLLKVHSGACYRSILGSRFSAEN